MNDLSVFAAAAIALYAAHHVGDYWVQTDHQARHKGDAGRAGILSCLLHVLSYLATQAIFLLPLTLLGARFSFAGVLLSLAVSGVTHYAADRRDHGVMFWLARRVPGKAAFLKLGAPRQATEVKTWSPCPDCEGRGAGGPAADESTSGMCWTCRAGGMLPETVTITDNPSLGTGPWALDQAWHIFWGVFVAALIIAA